MMTNPGRGKTVMVFGTFDLIHPGHEFFLNQAKRFGERFVVSIARDQNVTRIKGKSPLRNEEQRKRDVETLGIADQVVLGDVEGYLGHIKKISPDVICLGYDQEAYTKDLEDDLRNAGLETQITRIASFEPSRYKSSILKASLGKE